LENLNEITINARKRFTKLTGSKEEYKEAFDFIQIDSKKKLTRQIEKEVGKVSCLDIGAGLVTGKNLVMPDLSPYISRPAKSELEFLTTTHFQHDYIFMLAGLSFQDLMPVNPAPCRNILHHSGIGADDFQLVAGL
jgi:hypothetical protein